MRLFEKLLSVCVLFCMILGILPGTFALAILGFIAKFEGEIQIKEWISGRAVANS